MSPLTQYNITRHELIGLKVSIIQSSHAGYIGIRGRVVNETKNTLLITDGVERKCVPKESNVFRFTMPDNSIAEIEGHMILSRPVERIKND